MRKIYDFIIEGNNSESTTRNKSGLRLSSDEDMEKYSNNPKHKAFRAITDKYLEILGGDAETGKATISAAVADAIVNTNKILDIFNEAKITGFINGQMLGRIIETELAKSVEAHFNGFTFKQGSEGADEKDIDCKSARGRREMFDAVKDAGLLDDVKSSISGNSMKDKFFGIELKTSQNSNIIGNKAYANDDDSSKTKYAFYILINYDFPKQIKIDPSDQTKADTHASFDAQISRYSCQFCFLEQDDWFFGDKGSAASIKIGRLKAAGRLVEIQAKAKKERKK